MNVGSFFWTVKDTGKEVLVESSVFGHMAEFVGNNFLSVFLVSTEKGYAREINGTEIKMSRSIHFSEFLTEKPLTGYLKETDIEDKDTVVDAGAYPGEFSIYAAKNGADVIAIEPDPHNAEELRENIKLNNLEDKVDVVEKGLWDQKDTKKMERDVQFGLGSQIKDKGQLTIELDTLDNIFSDRDSLDLVKMDIEGAEMKALEGAEKVVDEFGPEFAIATYHVDEEGKKTCFQVEDILQNMGYEVDTGYKRHLTTYGEKNPN